MLKLSLEINTSLIILKLTIFIINSSFLVISIV